MWRAFLAALWLMPDAHAALAQAQTPAWPSKPVRISVPVTAGSAIDLVCRTVFDQVSQQLGQPFIIDNRGGGGGTLAPAAVAKADPDGYTLLSHSPSLTIFPATHNTLPYDTERDFTGVVALVNTPFLLVVSPEKYKTAGELVAAARAKPGALNYASVGHGGAAHINAERFRLSARIDVQQIPFRGVQEALTELLAGRVDFFFTPVLPSMPLIRDGRILPLAVSSNKRISSLPDLPTLAEAGLSRFRLSVLDRRLRPLQDAQGYSGEAVPRNRESVAAQKRAGQAHRLGRRAIRDDIIPVRCLLPRSDQAE